MYHVKKKIELKKVAGKVSSLSSDYSTPVINLGMCNSDA